MDERRQKLLTKSLRATGKLVNSVGEQFWHGEEKETGRQDRAAW